MTDAIAWLIVLPLAWGTLAFVLGPGRGALAGLAGTAAQLALALALAAAVREEGRLVLAAGGWPAPLGIELAADGLSVAMLLMAQVVGLPLCAYAAAFFRASPDSGRYFWPLCGYLFAGVNALFLSADLFNLYVALEVTGLASVGLVAAGGSARQVAAALRYLLAMLAASGAYVFGVALIYAAYGTVSLTTLASLVGPHAPAAVGLACLLMLAGLMAKAALVPFHAWLPPAHGSASPPVSALLSGIVVKLAFYLIVRLWTGPFAPLVQQADGLPWLLGLLGVAAIIYGSAKAIHEKHLKVLIAYSTVAQVGYLFLLFPLFGTNGALPAAVMLAFAHATAKSAMFMAAGVMVAATGRDTVDSLAGAAGQLPVALFAFGLAGVTIMGLPPSAGFLAKWLLLDAALAAGQWPVAAAALGGGLLTAVYVFRVLRHAFESAPPRPLSPVSPAMQWSAFLLAALSIVLSFHGAGLANLANAGSAP